MKKTKTFYVYELIDPRDNSVFYVGKGSGNRIDWHTQETCEKKRKAMVLFWEKRRAEKNENQ